MISINHYLNIIFMNADIIQQEILLLTSTTFSQKQFCERDNKNDSNNLSESEKLEKAIWDGLLDELLPEVITNRKLRIWQIWASESSLQIELGECPSRKMWSSSINPYYFLRMMTFN